MGRRGRGEKLTNHERINKDKNISAINKIVLRIQEAPTSQQNLIRQLREIYTEMNHNEFMEKIISILMFTVQQPEENYNSSRVLEFLSIFFASYKDLENNENPLFSAFNFVLTTDGTNTHIRFRLCKFVNTLLISLGENATLDNGICDQIQSYMSNRLKNPSGNVRAQAISALERLQVPDDPNDIVTKYFIFHLQADPSAKVRRSVISKIARNHTTIPLIIERVHDVVESVRQQTYIEMMKGFPVKSLKIGQRLTLLENGLTDESKSIRKIVVHLMITEWFLSYNDDYLAFLLALKLYRSDDDLQRYHKITKCVLREMFKRSKVEKLLAVVTFDETDELPQSTRFKCCIPVDVITLEHSVFWANLTEFLYDENSEHLDLVLPELTTYCGFLKCYLDFIPVSPPDDLEQLERGYILLNLFRNLKCFDYSDEVGKTNLISCICHTLKTSDLLNDQSIQTLVTVLEVIVPDKSIRFQMLNKVITDLIEPYPFAFVSDRPALKEILQCEHNSHAFLTITVLKLNIQEMQEQIADQLNAKEFKRARASAQLLNNFKQAYNQAVEPFLKFLSKDGATAITLSLERVSSSVALKCLKIIFYMVSSKTVNALTPAISAIYSNVISQYTESTEWSLQKWALKCGTAFALLSEQFSQDMFEQLHGQLLKKPCSEVWKVTIRAIFQLLVRYDLEKFHVIEEENNDEGDAAALPDLLSLLLHIMDTCPDTEISNSVVEGFCQLCLNSSSSYPDIVTLLLIKYFDPATDSKANQILGVFFKALVTLNNSIIIEKALIPTITEVLEADPISSLGTVKPENIIRFVVNISDYALIAESFLKHIQEHLNTKPLLAKMLSFELFRLKIGQNCEIKFKLLEIIDGILLEYKGGQAIKQNLINYKNVLNENGTHGATAENVTLQSVESREIGSLEKSLSDNELIYFTGEELDEIETEDQEEESPEINIISSRIADTCTSPWERTLRRLPKEATRNVAPMIAISTPNQNLKTSSSSTRGFNSSMPQKPDIKVTKLTPDKPISLMGDRKSKRVAEKNKLAPRIDEVGTPTCRAKQIDVMSVDRKSRPHTRLAVLMNTIQTRSKSNPRNLLIKS